MARVAQREVICQICGNKPADLSRRTIKIAMILLHTVLPRDECSCKRDLAIEICRDDEEYRKETGYDK